METIHDRATSHPLKTRARGQRVELEYVSASYERDRLSGSRPIAWIDVIAPISAANDREWPISRIHVPSQTIETEHRVCAIEKLTVVKLDIQTKSLTLAPVLGYEFGTFWIKRDADREIGAADRLDEFWMDVDLKTRKEAWPRGDVAVLSQEMIVPSG